MSISIGGRASEPDAFVRWVTKVAPLDVKFGYDGVRLVLRFAGATVLVSRTTTEALDLWTTRSENLVF